MRPLRTPLNAWDTPRGRGCSLTPLPRAGEPPCPPGIPHSCPPPLPVPPPSLPRPNPRSFPGVPLVPPRSLPSVSPPRSSPGPSPGPSPPRCRPPQDWPDGGDGGDSQREGPGGAGDRRRLRAGPGHGGAAGAARGSRGAAGPAHVPRGPAGPGAGRPLRLRPRRRDLSQGGGGSSGRGPEAIWPPGPGRELRRHRHRRQDLQQQEGQSARPGGLPEGHQREPGGHLQRDPPQRAADEPQQARRRRPPRPGGQHRQRGRLRGAGGSSGLLGLQGRHRGHDPAHRPRPGAAGHPRGHHRPRAVLHAAPGRFARESPEFFGSASAFPVPPGGPCGVRPPGAGAGREPHDQRGGGEAGRGPAHAALSLGWILCPKFWGGGTDHAADGEQGWTLWLDALRGHSRMGTRSGGHRVSGDALS